MTSRVTADVATANPGSSQALTFAIKSLVGGSAGVSAGRGGPGDRRHPDDAGPGRPQRERATDPHGRARPGHLHRGLLGADQAGRDRSTRPPPRRRRRATVASRPTIDKLPTSVTVDVLRQGETQTIDYQGSAPINLRAGQRHGDAERGRAQLLHREHLRGEGRSDARERRDAGCRGHPLHGQREDPRGHLPDPDREARRAPAAHLCEGAPDPEVGPRRRTPTTEDQTAFTYDADSELQDVELAMYDLNEADETNLQAKATGIPTHMEFQQTKSHRGLRLRRAWRDRPDHGRRSAATAADPAAAR